ncbi:enoyl-CoA hydratase-related protein [Rhodoligotrophos defluvii]|uniref:enoyl-CoA hydratase-related protein n=1 Tax=Rhodoligotrophos defluvii TaxID=2561934 RepID=UPI0010C9A6A2|nr:enoyl-CoA hydratase-related protein [Rhodoligotrophos defluvii]
MSGAEQSPLVKVERRARVLEIVLDHPPVNAINRRLSREVYAAARSLQEDSELGVGLVTGAGERAFSAGWDFREALATASEHGSPFGNTAENPMDFGGFGGITNYPGLLKPLVAAVQAPAIGGGFEIALACDVIVMAEDAFFQLPEMQRGILPDAGGVQRLPRRVPRNVAVELMLTGRRMTAQEARHWGLVHAVYPRDELLDAARALADEIAEGAPLAMQALKEVLAATELMPLEEAMRIDRQPPEHLITYRRMMASRDAEEGPRAFLEKRKPVWRGQ